MPKSNLVDVTVGMVAETEKAYCVSDDGTNRIWVPKSQVELEPIDKARNIYVLTAPEWLLLDKGLI